MSQASFTSQYTTNNNKDDSIFKSGVLLGSTSDPFPEFYKAAQSQIGVSGQEYFGSFGKEEMKNFLDQEEAECLEANPFIEEEIYERQVHHAKEQ